MRKLSLIIPCYNEEETVNIFYDETKKIIDTMDVEYEILFVNDGSSDNTLKKIKDISCYDKHVKYVSFSRNFGKEAAMYAGFCNVEGDYVAVMDADMQDPPSLLPTMLDIIEKENYDSVATRRETRKGEPKLRTFFARMFYKIVNKISDSEIVDGARDFRLMKREMVDAIIAMNEYNRFSKGIFGWIGFNTYWLPYENVERVAGKTSWSFRGLTKYALDGIVSFSNAPLNIASYFGIVMTFCSFFFLIVIIVRKLIFGDPVVGWASTVSIIIFLGGIQLLCLGIIGKYLSKTYMETKNRPHYIIADTNYEDIKKVN